MSILISGGGLAGLTARLAFQRLGISTETIDLAPTFAKPENDTSLVLTSNATHVLHELGLSSVIDRSNRLDAWTIQDIHGKKLGGVNFEKLKDTPEGRGNPTISIKYNDLLSKLLEAGGPKNSETAKIRMAAGVEGIEPSMVNIGAVTASFTTKSMKPKVYNLVVGSDGVASKVREAAVGPIGSKNVKVAFPGWGYWSSSVPSKLCEELTEQHRMVEIWAPGIRFGLIPMAGAETFCYATVNHSRPTPPTKTPRERANAMVEHCQSLRPVGGGAVGRVLEHLEAGAGKKGSSVRFDYPAPVEVLQGPHRFLPVALAGDAARCVLPSLFQGPALAMTDAWTLAQAVADPAARRLVDQQELPDRLEAWQKSQGETASLARLASAELVRAAAQYKGASAWFSNSLLSLVISERALHTRLKGIYRL